VTLICAKFGKNLFDNSKDIGRKTNWPRFLAYPVLLYVSIDGSIMLSQWLHWISCQKLIDANTLAARRRLLYSWL